MIISVNWLKKFTDITLPIDELATLIGARLVEIEEVIDLGAKYKDVVVARVVSSEPIKDSDHLNVVKIDDGGKAESVERDENGLVQVVCGAPNVREGILIAWLPPNSVVPETYGTSEPFVLDARKLRGYMSNGMIASPRELALYDEHSGILELDKADLEPGSSFAAAYELDDYLLDIENKSLTHRPDTFGIIGFAREVAAIQGKAFTTPDWLQDIAPQLQGEATNMVMPMVTIDDPELSSRYQAAVITNVDGKAESSLQLKTYLARIGVRPISAVVDVTNYIMMLTGQPLHAFDYDKVMQVGGGKADIHVRAGRDDEKLMLLDGREITLTPDDIVIAIGDTAVGLAGAMGGNSTEIDENTKNIILESATFNLYNLRATQMRHGIFSEAITRFTKGQPAALTAPALAQAVHMIADMAGGVRAGGVIEAYPGRVEPHELAVESLKINQVLGTNHTIEDMLETLRNVEFDVKMTDEGDPKSDGMLYVIPPYWRADIHIDEDIVEEFGRLEGFDTIEPTLPRRDFTAVRPDSFDQLRAKLRQLLVRAGANEVLTYTFVHGDILRKAEQKPEDSYRVVNSISPDLQYYRQTLTPSLLSHIHPNSKQGFDHFGLFELNKVHPKQHGMTDEGVPKEAQMLAYVVTDRKPFEGAPYYEAKRMLDFVSESFGLELEYAPIIEVPGYPVTAPFEYRRSALVTDKKTNTFIGIVGEYKKSVAKAFKLPEHTAGFEVGTEALHEAMQKLPGNYTPISRYPATERDICFQVTADVSYQQIINAARSVLLTTELETTISPVDIYQPDNNRAVKNITIRIKFTSHDHTLTGEEVALVVDKVIASAVATTKATVI